MKVSLQLGGHKTQRLFLYYHGLIIVLFVGITAVQLLVPAPVRNSALTLVKDLLLHIGLWLS